MDEHVQGAESSETNLFRTDELPPAPSQTIPDKDVNTANSFAWTTSEFVEHKKTSLWYGILGVITILLAAAVWFFAHDIFLLIVLIIGVVTFGVYAGRHPKQQEYLVDDEGVKIGTHRYVYADFGSFSIIPEGEMIGIEFLPLKRFATYMTIYINPADQAKIMQILSRHLPEVPARNDLMDRLLRHIQF